MAFEQVSSHAIVTTVRNSVPRKIYYTTRSKDGQKIKIINVNWYCVIYIVLNKYWKIDNPCKSKYLMFPNLREVVLLSEEIYTPFINVVNVGFE